MIGTRCELSVKVKLKLVFPINNFTVLLDELDELDKVEVSSTMFSTHQLAAQLPALISCICLFSVRQLTKS